MILQTRVAGIILRDNEILLIHRIKDGKEFWVFPGGSLEDTDKSTEDGLLRELKEETTVKVAIKKLIYTHDYTMSRGLYFLCEYISGEPKLGDSVEMKRMEERSNDTYEPVWVNTNDLSMLLVYPLEIRDWVIEDLKSLFINTPRTQKMSTKDLRNY